MDAVVLISTFSRMKKYAQPIEAAIDRCWPRHPSVCFVADCELSGVRKQFLFDASWTEILFRSLLTLNKEYSGVKHIFYLLDDHCPLRPCDTEAISAYLEIARTRGLAVISFPTYQWPWDRTEFTEYPDHLVRTWRHINIEVINGRRLAIVPKNFFRYYQLQPALWDFEYLLGTCQLALDRGIKDPWTFEAMQCEKAAQHFVADYNWPSVHHGFMAEGKINHAAISYMSKNAVPELRAQLIKDVVGINNVALYQMQRWAGKNVNFTRRIASAAKRGVRRIGEWARRAR